jgi:hypothetical protein
MIMRSIITVAVLASLGAVSASAAPKGGAVNTAAGKAGWTQSDNANACFGQSGQVGLKPRAGTNPYYPAGTTNGVISQRAQNGTNKASNDSFIATTATLEKQDLIKMGGLRGRPSNILPRVVGSACRRREWSGAT